MTGGKTHSSCWGKKPPLYKRVPCVSCTETVSISAVFLHSAEKNHFGGGWEIIKKKKNFWSMLMFYFYPKRCCILLRRELEVKKKITLRKELNKKQKKSRRISHVLLKAPTAQHQCNVWFNHLIIYLLNTIILGFYLDPWIWNYPSMFLKHSQNHFCMCCN